MIYLKSVREARESNELEEFKMSHEMNLDCKEAIEAGVKSNWDGWRLREGCINDAVSQYGAERVEFIMALSIHHLDYDGRISQRFKTWAEVWLISHEIPTYYKERHDYRLNIHSAIFDGLLRDYLVS